MFTFNIVLVEFTVSWHSKILFYAAVNATEGRTRTCFWIKVSIIQSLIITRMYWLHRTERCNLLGLLPPYEVGSSFATLIQQYIIFGWNVAFRDSFQASRPHLRVTSSHSRHANGTRQQLWDRNNHDILAVPLNVLLPHIMRFHV